MITTNIRIAHESTSTQSPNEENNYELFLQSFGVNYKSVDYYYQVGEVTKTQGWILHISVIISQVTRLMESIIPFLVSEQATFKIAMNKNTCHDLLYGYLGTAQIGKIICIYPDNEQIALSLAKKLIQLTSSFKGPSIPTDILLGGNVYTRYGSFNPVLLVDRSTGKEEKFIYNLKGELIKDPYTIPFSKPVDVSWPFNEIAIEKVKTSKIILNHNCRLVSLIKENVRGNVYKGVYLKSLFSVKSCVVKEGMKNMCSENSGRDVADRLKWQQELSYELSDNITMPKIIDFILEDGNSYLVMEYIKGGSLYDKLTELNPKNKSLFQLNKKEALLLLDYLSSIITAINQLHEKGYVHRDITPANFLINRKNKVFLIDLELAYCIQKKSPTPPFQYGTAGFMSPEQELISTPTTKEDIYGFGALLIKVLTGLSPTKFDTQDSERLFKNLLFFIRDHSMSSIITSCLQFEPLSRPNLIEVEKHLTDYKKKLKTNSINSTHVIRKPESENLKEIISSALEGLNKAPIPILNDLWYSKSINISNISTPKYKEYIRYPGLEEGISGVLYLLARVNKIGFNIDSSMTGYIKGWEFIEEQQSKLLPNSQTGLYSGTAGMALALLNGIQSKLLDDNELNKEKLMQWVQPFTSNLDLANGIVGNGISILRCGNFLTNEFTKTTLGFIIDNLLNNQQKNGSWLLPGRKGENKSDTILSFAFGITGIIWFLLEYISIYSDPVVEKATRKSLNWLLKKTKNLNHFLDTSFFEKSILNKIKMGDERKGIILTLIKAYEVLNEEKYKIIAERALAQYPSYIVSNNYTQQNGLAAMGELYLEASRVFKTQEWSYRTDWIVNTYIHTIKLNQFKSGYWKINDSDDPTADFMTGISGIIHFLARYLNPNELGYRFLK